MSFSDEPLRHIAWNYHQGALRGHHGVQKKCLGWRRSRKSPRFPPDVMRAVGSLPAYFRRALSS